MKKNIFIGIIFFLSFSIYSQSTPNQLINNFFEEFPKNSDKAIDDLYATNPWSLRIKDGIERIKKEINSYTVDEVGEYYGYEPITNTQLSESFILLSYIIKYDRQPLRFTFMFYKPNNQWRLYSFKIDAELASEIEEASKIYFLNLD
jgi:hypothetical protein